MKPIYIFEDYKAYLHERIRRAPKAGHGYRRKLAEAMNCQPTYFSQVMQGAREFSSDQAVLLAQALELDRHESEYFLHLVSYRRAGSRSARLFFKNLLERKREDRMQIRGQVKISDELSEEDKSTYYSDLLYAAVHMAVTIPQYRTSQALEKRLKVSAARIRGVLDFLVEKGLVLREEGQYLPGRTLLFVSKDSPLVLAHHRNWRLKALESAAERRPEDYHLTLGVTVSEADAHEIRQKIAALVEELALKIKASPEEKLMGLCLDFFEV